MTDQEMVRTLVKLHEKDQEISRLTASTMRLKADIGRLLEKVKVEKLKQSNSGFYVLLSKTETGWKFVAIVNPDQEEEIPEQWDLSLPIPNMNTVAEFDGW